MKTDDGFLLPPLQPEIPGNPTVVLIHSPVALAPVIEHAPPSVRPELRPWSGLSSPRTRSVSASPRPDGRDAPSPGRRRLRSRRTPSASDRRRWVAVHFPVQLRRDSQAPNCATRQPNSALRRRATCLPARGPLPHEVSLRPRHSATASTAPRKAPTRSSRVPPAKRSLSRPELARPSSCCHPHP